MIKLLDENAKVRAIPLSRRSTLGIINQLKAMGAKLKTTFSLWPHNAHELIKNQEDRGEQNQHGGTLLTSVCCVCTIVLFSE